MYVDLFYYVDKVNYFSFFLFNVNFWIWKKFVCVGMYNLEYCLVCFDNK